MKREIMPEECVDWSDIGTSDTNVIMHFYRGELQRVNTWRQRMDRTTNWSIVITVGVLTWSLSSPSTPHWSILPGLFLVYALLFTEARRYRYYDMWRGRIRVMEERFLTKFFDRREEPEEGWENLLALDLKNPRFKVSWQEAVKRRLKRIYIYIILIFTSSWIAKIYAHPTPVKSLRGFFTRVGALGGPWTGIIIMMIVLGSIVFSTLYFFSSVPEREAKGEIEEKKVDEKFGTEEYIEEVEDEIEEK